MKTIARACAVALALATASTVHAQTAPEAPPEPADEAPAEPPEEPAEEPAEEPPEEPAEEPPGEPAKEPPAATEEPAPAARGDAEDEWEAIYRAPEAVEAEVSAEAKAGPGSGSDEGPEPEKRVLHGFRLGYGVIMNADQVDPNRGETLMEAYGLKSPHLFVLGYELFYRLVGHSWLNVILVGNVSVAGLEQSAILPSANGIIGFELDQSFQLGVGVNLMPDEHKASHMVAAAGWTPRVGSFYVPVHFHLIPDVDQNHRAGVTIGVNW